MTRLALALLALSALFGPLLAGCSTNSASVSTSADAGLMYVPIPSDFCNYTSWTTYVEPDAGGDGVIIPVVGTAATDAGFIHAPGGRIEYINHVPPHGSKEFPIGTLIVKSIPSQQQVFAMAKVGGGYNPNGPDGVAINWEWIELNGTGCDLSFIWSGTPPASQAYGGNPQACNMCHSGSADNDYVASSRILLKDY